MSAESSARDSAGAVTNSKSKTQNVRTILLSAKGKQWKQSVAVRYAKKYDHIILICGRYEGVDERALKFIDEEISIGEYVLTGGELGALALIDSMTRLIPGVLGNTESTVHESHSREGVLEHPQYTRPEVLEISGPSTSRSNRDSAAASKKLRVPKVLLGGNHAEIEAWREKKRKKL